MKSQGILKERPVTLRRTLSLLKPWAFTCRHESLLLIGNRQVPSEQACESTGGVRADRCAGYQGGMRADRCAGSPGGEPFDQAPPPTTVPTAPIFNVTGAAV